MPENLAILDAARARLRPPPDPGDDAKALAQAEARMRAMLAEHPGLSLAELQPFAMAIAATRGSDCIYAPPPTDNALRWASRRRFDAWRLLQTARRVLRESAEAQA